MREILRKLIVFFSILTFSAVAIGIYMTYGTAIGNAITNFDLGDVFFWIIALIAIRLAFPVLRRYRSGVTFSLLALAVLLASVFYTDGPVAMFVTLFLITLVLTSFVLAAWQLAKRDVLWTFVPYGQIKAIDSGEGNPVMMLANLPGHHADDKMEIVPGDGPKKTLLQKHFAMYFFGFPPRKVHEIWFTHERVNQNIDKDTPSSEWIQRDKKPTMSKFLLWEIPHTVALMDVDFQDRFQGDVLLEFRSRVKFPLVALYLRRGQFLDYAKQYFEAGAMEQLRKFSWVQFAVNESKVAGCGLMCDILTTINSIVPGDTNAGLAASSGIEVLDGFISRWEPNTETKQFLEAQEEAKLKGQADIETATQAVIQAEQEAKKLQIQAAADLQAAQTRAAGQNAVFNALLTTIMERNPNVDFNTALRMATQLAIATKMSDKNSPVTVLGAGINIGVTEPPRRS
jgi:hypothetical protein